MGFSPRMYEIHVFLEGENGVWWWEHIDTLADLNAYHSEYIEGRLGRICKIDVSPTPAELLGLLNSNSPPFLDEDFSIRSLGKYISGVDIDSSDFYTVTDPTDGLMRLLPATDECYTTRPNEKVLTRLICVREQ